MIIFLDTSAWIKYFLAEEGTSSVQQFLQNVLVEENNRMVASPITYPEVMATLKRALLGQRITQVEMETIIQLFEAQWQSIQVVTVTTSLVYLAGQLAKDYALRGCDAFQLATALESSCDLFVSSDKELNRAASQCEIMVWNPTNGDFTEL
jgi:hypothetical protein